MINDSAFIQSSRRNLANEYNIFNSLTPLKPDVYSQSNSNNLRHSAEKCTSTDREPEPSVRNDFTPRTDSMSNTHSQHSSEEKTDKEVLLDIFSTPSKVQRNVSTGKTSSVKSMKLLMTRSKSEGSKSKECPQPSDNIGIRLSLPDKIDIMRGLEAPGDSDRGLSSSKKILILEDKNSFSKILKSPFIKSKKRLETTFSTSNSSTTKETEKKEFNNRKSNEEITVMRTSELEPSIHQLNIPSVSSILIQARVCSLMEAYDQLLENRAKERKQWFDFKCLVGMSRLELEGICLDPTGHQSVGVGQESVPPPLRSRNPFVSVVEAQNPFETDTNSYETTSTAYSVSEKDDIRPYLAQMKEPKPHPSIIKSLLKCADDILVEDYFTETVGNAEIEENCSNIQVAIFSSYHQRKFIVCYRGSSAQHAKPIKTKPGSLATSNKKAGEEKELPPLEFSMIQQQSIDVAVNPIVHETYMEANLERRIFSRLDELTTMHPFCDVTFTGHSFGGSLAQLAATRCADQFPLVTVSCHVFGVPKIGDSNYRNLAHSLPNLNVVRIENGNDKYVSLPLDSDWHHLGHTVQISNNNNEGDLTTVSNGNTPSKHRATKSETSLTNPSIVAKAYKWGKKSNTRVPSSKLMTRMKSSIDRSSKKAQGKSDHEIRSYLQVLEQFTYGHLSWISTFVGEDGDGILTQDKEERLVV